MLTPSASLSRAEIQRSAESRGKNRISPIERREDLPKAKRIVVKIGSSSLTDARGRLDQSRLDGVAEVYSCAGDVDLIAKIKVRDHEQIADVVTGKINRLPGVRHSATHIAFRSYSSSEVEGGFSIGE